MRMASSALVVPKSSVSPRNQRQRRTRCRVLRTRALVFRLARTLTARPFAPMTRFASPSRTFSWSANSSAVVAKASLRAKSNTTVPCLNADHIVTTRTACHAAQKHKSVSLLIPSLKLRMAASVPAALNSPTAPSYLSAKSYQSIHSNTSF